MGSRIRENPAHVIECFCEVVVPNETQKKAWILQKYPEDFNDEEILKSVPAFSCPCDFTNTAVQHFSFVLTSLDSKWTFGYCRHAPNSPTLFVLLSFLPWHEMFYKTLNQIADLSNSKESDLLLKFLEALYMAPVPDPGLNLHLSYGSKEFVVYCPNHLKLASIPENRNLTEYFNAVDARNMMVVFASMLHERRIIVTSKKLSQLSACVQAANGLIYPMNWQHIFIPVLPKHLVDYLSAPMPFLIGVPASTMAKFHQSELSEVVVLDAENNRVRTPFKDLETMPLEIVSSLKRSLKNPNMMLGDNVSRAFMRALVQLIGGYRDSLKVNLGEKISFDADLFIQSRPPSVQPFLETMLHLQIFQQFIEDRLEMLNSGVGFNDEFEFEVNTYDVYSSNNLRSQYKEWVSTMKKEGGAFLKTVRSKVKDKSKRAYKDIRSKIHDIQKQPNQSDLNFVQPAFDKPRSAPSSPTTSRSKAFSNKRISNDVKNGVLDSINLPHTGIRRYKMLTVDELSLPEDSLVESSITSDNSLQRLDMGLMEDLHDIIYRRCSVSSDNLNSFGMEESIEDISLGFTDSFCDSRNSFLPTPVPPPRAKRTTAPAKPFIPAAPSEDEPLIQLDSMDELSLFDPLKKTNDADVFSFLAPRAVNNAKVAVLKQTIQNLSSNPHGSSFYQQSFYPPVVAQPGLMIQRYPVSGPQQQQDQTISQINGVNLFENAEQDVRPPLPPKTRPSSSRFFVPSPELSDLDKELLTDYGLVNSPIFQNTFSSPNSAISPNPSTNPSSQDKTLNIFGSVNADSDINVPNQKVNCNQQTSWQKFN